MKDYSLNKEERRDFVLNYDVTRNGEIIVNFAEGGSIALPYNEQNEQILITKMEEQVRKASQSEEKYKKRKDKYLKLFKLMLGSVGISTIIILASQIFFVDTIFAIILAFSGIYGVSFLANCVSINKILEDLEKNKRFLEVKDIVNNSVKNDKNALVNVSNYTKRIVKNNMDVDRPLFDINSFNYVDYEDIEQIVENVERNLRFGFVYDEEEIIQPRIRTRRR